jgi:hypothetical protein
VPRSCGGKRQFRVAEPMPALVLAIRNKVPMFFCKAQALPSVIQRDAVPLASIRVMPDQVGVGSSSLSRLRSMRSRWRVLGGRLTSYALILLRGAPWPATLCGVG